MGSRAIFAANLRSLVARYPSISHVCRQIGINRQQFNRYLSGQALPSPRNLSAISAYFGVASEEMFRDIGVSALPEYFLTRIGTDLLNELVGFSLALGSDQSLDHYLGYYSIYSETEAGVIARWLLRVARDGAFCRFKLHVRRKSRTEQKAAGLLFAIGNRLVFAGKSFLGETVQPFGIMAAVPEKRPFKVLSGVSFGALDAAESALFATVITLHYHGPRPNLRALVRSVSLGQPHDTPQNLGLAGSLN